MAVFAEIYWVFIGIKARRYSWNIVWHTSTTLCYQKCDEGAIALIIKYDRPSSNYNIRSNWADRTSGNFSAPVGSKTIACLAVGNNRRKIWIYPSASPRRWNRATTNRCIFGNCRTIHQGWEFNLGLDVGIIGKSFPVFAGCGIKGDRPQVFEARWAIVFSVYKHYLLHTHQCQVKTWDTLDCGFEN